jgi:hypothetical protein
MCSQVKPTQGPLAPVGPPAPPLPHGLPPRAARRRRAEHWTHSLQRPPPPLGLPPRPHTPHQSRSRLHLNSSPWASPGPVRPPAPRGNRILSLGGLGGRARPRPTEPPLPQRQHDGEPCPVPSLPCPCRTRLPGCPAAAGASRSGQAPQRGGGSEGVGAFVRAAAAGGGGPALGGSGVGVRWPRSRPLRWPPWAVHARFGQSKRGRGAGSRARGVPRYARAARVSAEPGGAGRRRALGRAASGLQRRRAGARRLARLLLVGHEKHLRGGQGGGWGWRWGVSVCADGGLQGLLEARRQGPFGTRGAPAASPVPAAALQNPRAPPPKRPHTRTRAPHLA